MNPFKNTLDKVRALLKLDDNMTKEQCELFQWQLLVKVKDYTAFFGKGGINTMFYSSSSVDREVCYAEDMINLLRKLSKSKVFVYEALDSKKKPIGYSIDASIAKNMKGARTLVAINFKGKRKTVEVNKHNLLGERTWQEVTKV